MNLTAYVNPWGRQNYLFRGFWLVVWSLGQYLVPRKCGLGYTWRRWLLIRFGARVGFWSNVMMGVKIRDPRNLEVGDYSSITKGVNFYNAAKVTIGKNCVISANAFFCTATHDFRREDFPLVCKPIVVGDGVWIAMDAFILPGVTIGDGAVVGARSVVTKDVAPGDIVAGNPARVVGKREHNKEGKST